MSYGIPPSAFPIRPSGEIDYKIALQWIEDRRSIETEKELLDDDIDLDTDGMDDMDDTELRDLLLHEKDDGGFVTTWDDEETKDKMKDSIDDTSPSMSQLLQMPMIDVDDGTIRSNAPGVSLATNNQTQQTAFVTPPQSSSTSVASAEGDEKSRVDTIRPGKMDVILGRGKTLHQHPGNVRFRHILEMNHEEYEAAGKYAKTAIAEKILRIIHDSGGRFLQPAKQPEKSLSSNTNSKKRSSNSNTQPAKSASTTAYEEIDHLTARNKVSFTYRTMRASAKKSST